ncbi:hypothetical protein B9J08_04177 [Candidozyma auris]|uniref:PH domain-containing protein n=1 Tax=Candidozyma auris TaxID=498019 RepID=A0A2H0ZDB7_CANAR|nr:hypothetical protein B9J08_005294 [[Candida] auris]
MVSDVLPSSDRRSPFYVNTPSFDAKPVDHLVSYFKLWKHFIAALIAYLKDLLMAKEFESNLNLQLVGSVQFPGFRDLAFKTLSAVQQAQTSPSSPSGSSSSKELGKASNASSTNLAAARPGLPKQKSQSSIFKNQSFAHRKSPSASSLNSESLSGNGKPSKNGKTDHASSPLHHTSTSGSLSSSISAAKYAPKSDVTIDPSYFPDNSLFTNMANLLVNHHYQTYTAQSRLVKDLQSKLIPKLESLHRNLGLKIKEIKSSLKNDSFANPSLAREVSKTGAVINNFVSSVRRYSDPRPVLSKELDDDEDEDSMSDPFLVKLRLDYQLKNQLIHENYVYASYVNLQNISRDLLNYVIKDLYFVSERLGKLGNGEVYASTAENAVYNLAANLRSHINNASNDWEYFISHNTNFLNVYYDTDVSPKREVRSAQDIVIPYADSLHSKCLRCGIIYKKNKLIKSYTSYFYLLTCNYLHEFRLDTMSDRISDATSKSDKKTGEKSSHKRKKGKIGGVVGHDDTPVKSYNLNNYSFSIKSEKDFKFTLTKNSSTSHKFNFKCANQEDFHNWSADLHDLLKFSSQHLKRFDYIETKMNMREKQSTVKSEGGVPPRDMSLNLNQYLGKDKISVEKIQGESLSGMFTPRVQSPSETVKTEKNPFENTFTEISSPPVASQSVSPEVTSASQSPPETSATPASRPTSPSLVNMPSGAISPASARSPTGSGTQTPVESHEKEHEHYLKLQNEILKQQQQLMELKILHSPKSGSGNKLSLSRQSSAESIVSMMEQNTNDLSELLHHGKGLIEQPPTAEKLYKNQEANSSVPQVFVSNHENES